MNDKNNVKKKPSVLQISAGATHGGASGIALGIFEELATRRYRSQFATSCDYPDNKNILHIPKNKFIGAKNPWEASFFALCRQTKKLIGKIKGAGFATNTLYNIGRPSCLLKNLRGVENFENYPGTHDFFANLQPFPDIIHGHNLHGRFFDLRALAPLSKKVPVFLTLHDEWMFTGHCAYTFGCTKWKTGCGSCPNLSVYDPLWRDTSTYNFKQKEAIYKKSALHIVTPSQWLMDKAKQSILAPGIKTSRVINNGIDLSIFQPGDKQEAREQAGLQQNSYIILFVANQAKTNPFKDYKTLEKALFFIAESDHFKKPILLLCIGEKGDCIQKNNVTIQFISYLHGKKELVAHYQAADLFVHATKNDNFPTTILEALACGLPVIGTKVGGVPEQINDETTDNPTGMVYELKNYKELADKIVSLLKNRKLRNVMSKNAACIAKERFDAKKQISQQIKYYHERLNLP